MYSVRLCSEWEVGCRAAADLEAIKMAGMWTERDFVLAALESVYS